jgi:hypothetical protein
MIRFLEGYLIQLQEGSSVSEDATLAVYLCFHGSLPCLKPGLGNPSRLPWRAIIASCTIQANMEGVSVQIACRAFMGFASHLP